MRVDSRQTLHLGVNFIVAPLPLIDDQHGRQFLDALAEEGIQIAQFSRSEQHVEGVNGDPAPLQIRVAQAGPQVGQLLITAPRPNRPLNIFARETASICDAFNEVWTERYQILSRDCTVTHLYASAGDHAFQYLWEKRLGQKGSQFEGLGRPVLGGGLRLVMPPEGDGENPSQVEVKIESFLRDSTKIYVEVQFSWPAPVEPNVAMNPIEMLETVEKYASNEVVNFILGGPHAQ